MGHAQMGKGPRTVEKLGTRYVEEAGYRYRTISDRV